MVDFTRNDLPNNGGAIFENWDADKKIHSPKHSEYLIH